LLDDAWLWGGDIDSIYTTVAHGIRNEEDDDARYSEMPAFGEILEPGEITEVVNYIMSLSGDAPEPSLVSKGAAVYEENCSACHGEAGKGDRDLGAPGLTDALWLYGGDFDSLMQTVTFSRFGVMPAWLGRLTEAEVRAATIYVHQLGGGE
jgi:cytochrome c oxidase cbb3-type subunit 3